MKKAHQKAELSRRETKLLIYDAAASLAVNPVARISKSAAPIFPSPRGPCSSHRRSRQHTHHPSLFTNPPLCVSGQSFANFASVARPLLILNSGSWLLLKKHTLPNEPISVQYLRAFSKNH